MKSIISFTRVKDVKSMKESNYNIVLKTSVWCIKTSLQLN